VPESRLEILFGVEEAFGGPVNIALYGGRDVNCVRFREVATDGVTEVDRQPPRNSLFSNDETRVDDSVSSTSEVTNLWCYFSLNIIIIIIIIM